MHQIGVGVLGPVFRTYEPSEDRLVAVKAFHLDITPEQAQTLVDALMRLIEADLTHPGLAAPIDVGFEDGVPYMAQEYVAAESLDVAMRHYAPAPVETAMPFIRQIGEAIDAAHGQGVVHGALHLRDIFVSPEEVRLTGFGVVKALEELRLAGPIRRPYTAPEVIAGRGWGAEADLFALAAVAYELLTGRRAAGTGEQVTERLNAVENIADGEALQAVFATALSDSPDDRYSSAARFVSSLESAIGHEGSGAARIFAPDLPSASSEPPADLLAGLDLHGDDVLPGRSTGQAPVDRLASTEIPDAVDVDQVRDEAEDESEDYEDGELQDELQESEEVSVEVTDDVALIDDEIDDAEEDDELDDVAEVEDDAEVEEDAELEEDELEDEEAEEEVAAAAVSNDDDADYLGDETEPPDDEQVPLSGSDAYEVLEVEGLDEDEVSIEDEVAYEIDEDGEEEEGAEHHAQVAGFPFDVAKIRSLAGRGAVPLVGVVLAVLAVTYFVGSSMRTDGTPTDQVLGSIDPDASREFSEAVVDSPGVDGDEVGGDVSAVPPARPEPSAASEAPTARQETAPPSTPAAPPTQPAAPAATPSSASQPASAAGVSGSGWLLVRTDPPGARVLVDGVGRGETPLSLEDVAFGDHQVEITLTGFRPQRETVSISREEAIATLGVTLTPGGAQEAASPQSGVGALSVQSRPEGARVIIDGEVVGTTPARVEVSIGRHVVRLEIDGYQVWTTTVAVTAGEPVRLAASLDRTPR